MTGSVALLIFSGLFKSALSWLPVDLTVLSAGMVSFAVVEHLLRVRFHVSVPPLVLGCIGVCLPAMLYLTTSSEAWNKRAGLLLTGLVVIGCGILLRSYRRQQVWVWMHVAAGLILVVTASANETGRLAGAGTTIAAGRASGVAVVVLLCLVLTRSVQRWWAVLCGLGVVGWLTAALVSTGSRGPVFSCAAAMLGVAVAVPGRGRLFRVVAALGAVGAGWVTLTEATGIGATRITAYLAGDYGIAGARGGLWRPAVDAISEYPFGIGWGEFWRVLPTGALLDSGYRQYPHNVLLEVTIEAGWLAGAAVAVAVVLSLLRLRRAADHPYGAALFGIALFTTLNAMVSGDVNDNRVMWAALSLAWVRVGPGSGAAEQMSSARATPAATERLGLGWARSVRRASGRLPGQ